MDTHSQKEEFETLQFKSSVVKKFRSYCRTISMSHSTTLFLVVDFFEKNGISPEESLGPQIQTLEALINKRINVVIAILKNIEKTQTKPTAAMLQALLELEEPGKKPLKIEKKLLNIDSNLKEPIP